VPRRRETVGDDCGAKNTPPTKKDPKTTHEPHPQTEKHKRQRLGVEVRPREESHAESRAAGPVGDRAPVGGSGLGFTARATPTVRVMVEWSRSVTRGQSVAEQSLQGCEQRAHAVDRRRQRRAPADTVGWAPRQPGSGGALVVARRTHWKSSIVMRSESRTRPRDGRLETDGPIRPADRRTAGASIGADLSGCVRGARRAHGSGRAEREGQAHLAAVRETATRSARTSARGLVDQSALGRRRARRPRSGGRASLPAPEQPQREHFELVRAPEEPAPPPHYGTSFRG